MIEAGQTIEMKGSGKKPYLLKNIDGVYSCTCPAWRNQSAAIDKRTCKHLKIHNGTTFEIERIAGAEVGAKAALVEAAEAVKGRKLRPDEKAKLNGPPVLLAHKWEADVDPTGWWISEKLDGVRAYWDGKNFISRQGNIYHAPEWFKVGLPNCILDGELWMDRQCFQKTISIVKRQDADREWKNITYFMYDMPDDTRPFEERLQSLQELTENTSIPNAAVLAQYRCSGIGHLHAELEAVKANGGEGVMIREPGSKYEAGRSHTLLKVKSFFDAEAEVIGYTAGKGRHKGRTGALQVRMENGKEFLLGTGLSDAERNSPPAIGSKVTYRYTELTTDGIPKCGSFVCVRDYE